MLREAWSVEFVTRFCGGKKQQEVLIWIMFIGIWMVFPSTLP